jgi:hypothetical protein
MDEFCFQTVKGGFKCRLYSSKMCAMKSGFACFSSEDFTLVTVHPLCKEKTYINWIRKKK